MATMLRCPTTGKIRHATRDAALEQVKQLVWRNHLTGQDDRSEGLTPYLCDTEACGGWHVGHEARVPLVWHYTVGAYLKAILKTNALKPAPRRRRGETAIAPMDRNRVSKARQRRVRLTTNEPAPLLWFSRNPEWEYSVIKVERGTWRSWTELRGDGLVRFGVPMSFAKLGWADYLRLNATPLAVRMQMERRGDPREWLATNEPVALPSVRTMEVYYGAQGWTDAAAVDPEAYDRYLAERPAVYAAAKANLLAKWEAWPDANKDQFFVSLSDLTEAEAILVADLKQVNRERGDRVVEQRSRR